jgi:hypothetical protein
MGFLLVGSGVPPPSCTTAMKASFGTLNALKVTFRASGVGVARILTIGGGGVGRLSFTVRCVTPCC